MENLVSVLAGEAGLIFGALDFFPFITGSPKPSGNSLAAENAFTLFLSLLEADLGCALAACLVTRPVLPILLPVKVLRLGRPELRELFPRGIVAVGCGGLRMDNVSFDENFQF